MTSFGTSRTTTKTVCLAGATRLVGRAILEGLLADGSVTTVHAIVRRELGFTHPKLTPHVVDFAALPPLLPPLDEVYLALGTTIKAAGSQAAFRAVDFDANLAVARMALGAPALSVRWALTRSRESAPARLMKPALTRRPPPLPLYPAAQRRTLAGIIM